ncbi:hypothetical protein GUJ93_ZPchr0001g31539 [Zizania palustris]|uniref:Uncharacterized protein n=1 Tax=Zizania palustris TaxID=103762 RepID=A0A8J5VPG5_ZIZPA|nr:hypothetical protein GUJ93_ZPchr0001g31539 [Zizania palustris]
MRARRIVVVTASLAATSCPDTSRQSPANNSQKAPDADVRTRARTWQWQAQAQSFECSGGNIATARLGVGPPPACEEQAKHDCKGRAVLLRTEQIARFHSCQL